MIFCEALSTWSENIVLRSMLYFAKTMESFLTRRQLNMYQGRAVSISKPEFYVLYTGESKNVPTTLSFKEVYFPDTQADIDLIVHVITHGNSHDIISQYIDFCKLATECVRQRAVARKHYRK